MRVYEPNSEREDDPKTRNHGLTLRGSFINTGTHPNSREHGVNSPGSTSRKERQI